MSDSVTNRQPGFFQGLFLLLPIILTVVGVTIFVATVNLMQEHFSYLDNSDYLVNLLQTMPGFWIVAFSPVAGWLADKYGRLNMLKLSLVVYALFGVAPFFMESMLPILMTRSVIGMCEAVILTVTATMLCDYFKGAVRERWLASQTGVAALSAVGIIPLGGYLGAKFGWQGPFLVYLVSLLFLVGLVVFCWEPEKEVANGDDESEDLKDVVYTEIPVARLTGIIAITIVASVMFYTTITQNSNAFVSLGVTNPAEIGHFAMLASFGVPIGTFLFWGVSKIHISVLLFVEFMLIGVGFSWMSVSTTPMEYVYAANIQQIGCGLILPTLLVWATNGLAYSIRGRVNGMWQGTFGVGLFISGVSLTFLSTFFDGSILLAFGALAKVCFVGALFAALGVILWRKNSGVVKE